MSIAAALSAVDSNLDAAIERLRAWIAIPSISADPLHAKDCRAAASWLAAELGSMGFDVQLIDTAGHPVLVARRPRAGAKRALFYGHYDVQPPEPLQVWRTPPFDMTIVDDHERGPMLVGRGTSDDKGQVMTFVEACRAILAATGELPLDMTLLIEGEEEIGSPHLSGCMQERRGDFAADIVLACDTDMARYDVPGITVSMRGLLHDELVVNCARSDLHSGVYGGAARNPLHVISAIVAALHDGNGRVAIAGFYAGAETFMPLPAGGEDGYLADVGLKTSAGEPGIPPRQQTLFRPSADVNGIWGGYSGPGVKTVIPAQAGMKISFRLVPGQDPHLVRRQFRSFVESRLPEDCAVTFAVSAPGCVAMRVGANQDFIKRAAGALEAEWGAPTEMIATGGTIPAVAEIKRLLGLDTLMVGFSHENDMQHGPNEKFDLRSFHKGTRSWVRILDALA